MWRRIGRFLHDLTHPDVPATATADGYRVMAADTTREREALDWVEGVLGDIAREPG